MAAPATAMADPINDLSHLPLVLLVPDMSRLLRQSIGTIRRDLQRGTFRPLPYATRPYRWLRSVVEEYLNSLGDSPRPPVAAVQPTRRRHRR